MGPEEGEWAARAARGSLLPSLPHPAAVPALGTVRIARGWGCPGSGAAQAPGLPTPGLFVPGHAGGQGLARADTIKDGNLLIQALPALRCESGTVFFTTS